MPEVDRVPSTHWGGCWKEHHECAVARIEELYRRCRQLESDCGDCNNLDARRAMLERDEALAECTRLWEQGTIGWDKMQARIDQLEDSGQRLVEERDEAIVKCKNLERKLDTAAQTTSDLSSRVCCEPPEYKCHRVHGAITALRMATTELREAREERSRVMQLLHIHDRYLKQAQADSNEARTWERRLYATCKDAGLVCDRCGRTMQWLCHRTFSNCWAWRCPKCEGEGTE
jgi:chromosome segregation ATPase